IRLPALERAADMFNSRGPAAPTWRYSNPKGSCLSVFLGPPPLVVTEDEIEEGVRAADGALDDIGAQGGAGGGRRKGERKRGRQGSHADIQTDGKGGATQ